MTGSDGVRSNLLCDNQQLIKLQVIVAETAGDGRAPGKVLFDERTHHVTLKAVFMIYDVIGYSDPLSHTPCIVDTVERAAATVHRFRHALASSQPPLVPELHRQPDDVVPLGTEHGRDGGRIHTARHGDRDGV